MVVLAVAVWLRVVEDEPYVVPTPTPSRDVVAPATAGDTLHSLQRLLARGDADGAAALGSDDAAARLLGDAATNVSAARLGDVTFRYVDETGQVDGDAWSATVEVTWRIEGFDRTSGRSEVVVGFADEGRAISGVGASDGNAMPLWLTGPLDVRRSARTVVLAASRADRYAAQARTALTVVERVLGRGGRRLVVEVPESSSALNEAVGAAPGTYDDIAAVTSSSDGSLAPGSAIHVFVNPAVYGALGPVAAQVVMTHEAVHVVTEAPLVQGVELWLLEGFADYVALHGTRLPLSRTAGQVIEQVREDGVPDLLPTQAQFDSRATHLGAVYEASWLVCVTLADRGGEQAVVDLYDAVLAGRDLGSELRLRFGWSLADLTAAWQARLAALAGVPESARG